MYGTVARFKTRAGGLQAIKDMEQRQPPGFVATYVYQMDADSDELWMVVLFESKEAYFANAESPQQNREFEQLRRQLVAEPEWHDGQVVFHSP